LEGDIIYRVPKQIIGDIVSCPPRFRRIAMGDGDDNDRKAATMQSDQEEIKAAGEMEE